MDWNWKRYFSKSHTKASLVASLCVFLFLIIALRPFIRTLSSHIFPARSSDIHLETYILAGGGANLYCTPEVSLSIPHTIRVTETCKAFLTFNPNPTFDNRCEAYHLRDELCKTLEEVGKKNKCYDDYPISVRGAGLDIKPSRFSKIVLASLADINKFREKQLNIKHPILKVPCKDYKTNFMFRAQNSGNYLLEIDFGRTIPNLNFFDIRGSRIDLSDDVSWSDLRDRFMFLGSEGHHIQLPEDAWEAVSATGIVAKITVVDWSALLEILLAALATSLAVLSFPLWKTLFFRLRERRNRRKKRPIGF